MSRPSRASKRAHLGAGAGLAARRRRGVVGVGVGADDPADAVAAAAGDGVEVPGVVGPGVDHHDLVDADEVGVGAGAGHLPGVGGDDAPDHGAERAGHPVHQRRPLVDDLGRFVRQGRGRHLRRFGIAGKADAPPARRRRSPAGRLAAAAAAKSRRPWRSARRPRGSATSAG